MLQGSQKKNLIVFSSLSHVLFFFFFLVFLGVYPQHMEVPRLRVASELQLLAYTTATAMWDPSRVCDLHHSSQQCQILNPLSAARDGTRILMDPFPLRHPWNSNMDHAFDVKSKNASNSLTLGPQDFVLCFLLKALEFYILYVNLCSILS